MASQKTGAFWIQRILKSRDQKIIRIFLENSPKGRLRRPGSKFLKIEKKNFFLRFEQTFF